MAENTARLERLETAQSTAVQQLEDKMTQMQLEHSAAQLAKDQEHQAQFKHLQDSIELLQHTTTEQVKPAQHSQNNNRLHSFIYSAFTLQITAALNASHSICFRGQVELKIAVSLDSYIRWCAQVA